MADHEGVLAHIRGCTSLTELGALQAAAEQRTAALITAAQAPAAKRARTGNPVSAEGQDIEALARIPVSETDIAGKSEIRLLLNGCFDIMHAGHYNALRQAKALFSGFPGTKVVLVAGVHTDASIAQQKGPPVMNQEERVAMVKACKWVDEVAIIPEYLIDVALLDSLRCDFVAHGDDLPIRTDGTGMYHESIRANRFRMIQRTEGVSTTTFIGRLLQVTRPKTLDVSQGKNETLAVEKPVQVSATLLPTGSRVSAFAAGLPPLARAKRVVYVDGMFDVFHHGHLEFLRLARERGDYLLVGLHSDEVAAATHGPGHPIMSLHERALCLLACKFVDDIILGAPFAITANLCTSMNISVVCAGAADTNAKMRSDQDPYAVAKEMGIFSPIISGNTVTTSAIRERIVENYVAFKKRNESKEKAETVYEDTKQFLGETPNVAAAV